MAGFIETLTLLIKADATGAVTAIRGFGQTAQSELSKVEGQGATSGANAGAAFGNEFQKTALLGFAALQAATAGLAVGKFATSAVQDAVALDRANAALAATIKATGGEAGVTASSIDRLSQRIQASDAIYSGNVKQAGALLLTLRDIKNQEGAGNQIYNRALEGAAALSNVFGKDLNTTVLQLGRALENPVAGMQALQRSGVTFSQELRAQVEHLAKQGDLLGAQRTILDEIDLRYGAAGEAIAKADPFQQFSVSLQTFKVQLGEDLLPIISGTLHAFGDVLKTLDAFPEPVRKTVEFMALLGVVALPFVKVAQAFRNLGTIATAVSQPTSAAAEEEAAATGGKTVVAGGGPAAAKKSTGAAQQEAATSAQTKSTVVATAAEKDLAAAETAQGEAAERAAGGNATLAASLKASGSSAEATGAAAASATNAIVRSVGIQAAASEDAVAAASASLASLEERLAAGAFETQTSGIKIPIVLQGAEAATAQLEELRAKIDAGVDVPVVLSGAELATSKLEALRTKLDANAAGVDIPLVLSGVDLATARLEEIDATTRKVETDGIIIPVVVEGDAVAIQRMNALATARASLQAEFASTVIPPFTPPILTGPAAAAPAETSGLVLGTSAPLEAQVASIEAVHAAVADTTSAIARGMVASSDAVGAFTASLEAAGVAERDAARLGAQLGDAIAAGVNTASVSLETLEAQIAAIKATTAAPAFVPGSGGAVLLSGPTAAPQGPPILEPPAPAPASNLIVAPTGGAVGAVETNVSELERLRAVEEEVTVEQQALFGALAGEQVGIAQAVNSATAALERQLEVRGATTATPASGIIVPTNAQAEVSGAAGTGQLDLFSAATERANADLLALAGSADNAAEAMAALDAAVAGGAFDPASILAADAALKKFQADALAAAAARKQLNAGVAGEAAPVVTPVAAGGATLTDAEVAALAADTNNAADAALLLESRLANVGKSAGLIAAEGDVMASLGFEANNAADVLGAFEAQEAALAAETAATTPLLERLGGVMSGIGGAFAGSLGPIALVGTGLLLLTGIVDNLGKKAPDVQRLTASIDTFSKTASSPGGGQITGGLADIRHDLLGPGAATAAGRGAVEDNSFPGLLGVPAKAILGLVGQQQQINTFKKANEELDQTLAKLVDDGHLQDANRLFQDIGQKAEENGAKFPLFNQAIDDTTQAMQALAGASETVDDVFTKNQATFDNLSAKLSLASGLDSVKTATDQVKSDIEDIAGTSDKAKQADDAEAQSLINLQSANKGVTDSHQALADSYVKVADAQEQVGLAQQHLVDATHQLAEAQHELELFNSPRGQLERGYQNDILQRRFVTTPAEEDQKQLSILQNQDENERKAQQLADAVHSAQEGVASANRGVRDSYRAVADAQKGVRDAEDNITQATLRQKEAQEKVSSAIKTRAAVSADASARIKTDIDKEQTALLGVYDTLQKAVASGAILPDEVQHWMDKLGGVALILNGPVSTAIGNVAKQIDDIGKQQLFEKAFGASVTQLPPPGTPGGPAGPPTAANAIANYPPSNAGAPPGQHWLYVNGSGWRLVPNADGNILRYAQGTEDHTAQIAKAGDMRLWAEPETGGEAYIPLAEAKRSRSSAILGHVADMFGMELAPKKYADGGLAGDDHYGINTIPVGYANGGIAGLDDALRFTDALLVSDRTTLSDDEKKAHDERVRVIKNIRHDEMVEASIRALLDVQVIQPGNVDISNRPNVTNADGSVSTVRSITVEIDHGHAALLPTVIDGAVVSNEAAILDFLKTNEHLGIFGSPGLADHYAELLHEEQALIALPRFGSGGMVDGPEGMPQLAIVHGGEQVLTRDQQAAAYVDGGMHYYGDGSPNTKDKHAWAYGSMATYGDGSPNTKDKHAWAYGSMATYADGGVHLPMITYADGGAYVPDVPRVYADGGTWSGGSSSSSHTQNVTQENHFHGDTPAKQDLDYANRELGWRLSRTGRG